MEGLNKPFRLIVGMTGASGQIYGMRLLEVLRGFQGIETHLVMSEWAERTISMETEWRPDDIKVLADKVYDINDLSAAICSGSFKRDAMVVIPCSIKSLSAIAYSFSLNSLIRAADVTLKERKPLVLVVREAPLHLGHLENMIAVTKMGGILFPPVPSFYVRPNSIDDIVTQTVGRVLDVIGLDQSLARRWGEGGDRKA